MKTTVKALMVLTMIGMISLAFAQDNKGGKKRGNPAAGLLKKVDALTDLTAEQKEKIAAINKEHEPKLTAAAKKVNDSLTPEQRRTRQEAQKAGKDAGKKGKEIKAEALAAMKLTDEQKKTIKLWIEQGRRTRSIGRSLRRFGRKCRPSKTLRGCGIRLMRLS